MSLPKAILARITFCENSRRSFASAVSFARTGPRFAEGGSLSFGHVEFTNASDGYLSRYSIGVKDKYELRMVGGFYVDVVHVAPGTAHVVHVPMGGYSHLLTAEDSVLFDNGEPKPESRGDFWEFRAINNETAQPL